MIEAIKEAFTTVIEWIGQLTKAFPEITELSGAAVIAIVLLILKAVLRWRTK